MSAPNLESMTSPLPDSSALEAGLIPDARLPGSGHVQDDVRNLLLEVPLSGRVVYTDVCRSPDVIRTFNDDFKCRSIFEEYATAYEGIASPKLEGTYAPSLLEYYARSPRVDLETGMVLFPQVQKKQDKIPTIAYRRRSKRRRCAERDARSQVLTCVALTCFLSALVAAYISQAIPPRTLHPALHTVFIISIIASTILLAFYTARLTKRTTTVPRHLWAVRHHHRRPRRRHNTRRRWSSTPSVCSSAASITSAAGLLRTPTPLRPSPKAVKTPADVLPTPPAARTARSSSHYSTNLGEFYIQDMKPLSSPTSPERPSQYSPMRPSPRPPPLFGNLESVPEMAQLPSHSPPLATASAPSSSPLSPPATASIITPRADSFILPATTFTPLPHNIPAAGVHNTAEAVPRPATPVPRGTSVLSPTMPFDDDELEQGRIMISAPPPAYGRWRGSVRVDPNLLSWRHLSLADVEGRGLPGYDDDAEEVGVVEIRVEER
ncbi:hypothetical protein B9Z65_7662 [Elsinoe australis]|uniref:Uncharacterized protein n=1 Tax=Elsinoe australis TaxID=40998 RepID=A0A2P8A0A8_9PEZI|nr:hypothetical protein B9Z65_7662 [Elsinoe australis]